MPIKKIHLYFILFFFFSLSIQGQWQISKEDLAKAGIEHSSFKMAILTTKGNLAIGYEYLDLEHRKKGEIYALHLIYLKPNNAFEVKSVVLPFTFLVGIGLIQNEKKAIIVGNYGTKIIILDLKTLEIKTIFEYQPKQPGFRTGTLVVGFKNKVYLSGYFYDKDQYWLGDYVAELIVSEDTNNIEFYKKINLQDAYSQIGGQPYIYQLISGNMAYFGIPRQRDSKNRPQMDLYFYKNKKVEKIASGLTIGAFAGTEDVVFYTVFKNS
ncbi:MAG TPA: hypothetical protein PKM32_06155, partial [Planctomycetota bacterium]|nr:hypothetical protein [Planctomycetota bacterium]